MDRSDIPTYVNDEPDIRRPPSVRPLALAAIAGTGVFASAALGAVTNAINGWVSPLYFVTIMRWQGVENVWLASIAQGVFEGLCFGVFFSLVFTAGVAILTRASCSYAFAALHLLGILAGACRGVFARVSAPQPSCDSRGRCDAPSSLPPSLLALRRRRQFAARIIRPNITETNPPN